MKHFNAVNQIIVSSEVETEILQFLALRFKQLQRHCQNRSVFIYQLAFSTGNINRKLFPTNFIEIDSDIVLPLICKGDYICPPFFSCFPMLEFTSPGHCNADFILLKFQVKTPHQAERLCKYCLTSIGKLYVECAPRRLQRSNFRQIKADDFWCVLLSETADSFF